MKKRKAIIVYPFYWNSNDVGNKRIERFKFWLLNLGYELVIISGGRTDKISRFDWGVEIEIKDPLGIHKGKGNYSEKSSIKRKPNKLRRLFAYLLFCPDLSRMWSRNTLKNEIIKNYIKNADLVISSSPPESSHITAVSIAREINASLIVDMRDGWLDEPLKPLLKISALWRWREGLMERKTLNSASRIFVTSNIWKKLLVERYPKLENKTIILPNGYPNDFLLATNSEIQKKNKITILHSGSFSLSSVTRKIGIVLKVIHHSILECNFQGELKFIGRLEEFEDNEAHVWNHKFEKINWSIKTIAQIPKLELYEEIKKVDGLILLSTSLAAVPSKLFEYVPSRKPFLVIAPRSSAVWEICSSIPQAFLVDIDNLNNSKKMVADFLEVCRNKNYQCTVPNEFSFDFLSKIFKSVINEVINESEYKALTIH